MQALRKFIQEIDKATARLLERKIFEVDHEPAVVIAGKECPDFLAKSRPSTGIVEEIGNVDPVRAIKIVYEREVFCSRVLRLQEGHDFVVDRVNGSFLNHSERPVGLFINALQVAIGCEHVQPCRIKKVDLACVFAK